MSGQLEASDPPEPPTSPPVYDTTQLPSLVKPRSFDSDSCSSGVSHHTVSDSEPPSPPPGIMSPVAVTEQQESVTPEPQRGVKPETPDSSPPPPPPPPPGASESPHNSLREPTNTLNVDSSIASPGVVQSPGGTDNGAKVELEASQEPVRKAALEVETEEAQQVQDPILSMELPLPPVRQVTPSPRVSDPGRISQPSRAPSSHASLASNPSPASNASPASNPFRVPDPSPASSPVFGESQQHAVDLRAPGVAPSYTPMGIVDPPALASPPVRAQPAQPAAPAEPIVGTLPSEQQLHSLGKKISRQSISSDGVRHVQNLLTSLKARGKPVSVAPEAQVREGGGDAILKLLAPEEDMGRAVIVQSEVKMRESLLCTVFGSGSRASCNMSPEEKKRKLERKRDKKIQKLKTLRQAEIHRAWQQGRREPCDVTEVEREEESKRVMEANKLTKSLRQHFKGCSPPFACNVHDLWNRGIIVPPEEQPHTPENPIASDKAYHELAAGLRRSYWQQRVDREQECREEEFKSSLSSKPTRGDGLPYLSKTNPTTSASQTPTSFGSIVERFEYELEHGPTDDCDPRTAVSRWKDTRQPWK